MNLTEQLRDFRWFAERFFWIRDPTGVIIPFRMNQLQDALYAAMTGRDDVLKARQGGCSTFIILLMLHRCITQANYRALILAHEARSARKLMAIAEIAISRLPPQLAPKLTTDTRTEKTWGGIGSSLECATARNPDIGRGGSINMLHCSEIAMWDFPSQTLAALSPSLGPDSSVFRESTARGAGNYWHKQWVLGKARRSGYVPQFFPWWVEPRYRVVDPNLDQDPDEFEDGERIPFVLSKRESQLPIDEEQARWRRRQVMLLGVDFAQEFAEDDTTCFLTSGRAIFDMKVIRPAFELLIEKPRVVRVDLDLGLTIYIDPLDKKNRQREYVIGADPAEGIADMGDPSIDGDFCSAAVLDRRTGEQAATIYGSWETFEFARILSRVGHMYSDTTRGPALLGVERNNHGTAVLSELWRHLQYSHLYSHHHYDEKTQVTVKRLGWHTNSASRPIMVGDLIQSVAKGFIKPADPDFFSECMTFVRDNKGKAKAQQGCHDDRVMSMAIAVQMRGVVEGAPLVATNLS